MKSLRRILSAVLVLMFLFLEGGAALAAALTVPPATRNISAEAFYGDTSLEQVVIPEGCLMIGERAFANCQISKVTFPSTLSYIAPTAFDGNSGMKVDAAVGTYAYDWAEENGFETLVGSVSNLQALVYEKNVTLFWDAASNAEGYRISEKTSGGTSVIATVDSDTFYEMANVSIGTHTYVVEAYKPFNGSYTYGSAVQVNADVSKIMVESIRLNRSYVELDINGTASLQATVSPASADTKSVTWRSSNSDVVSVSSAGEVTALSSGTATITATAKDGSGVSTSCVVEVSVEEPYLTVTHQDYGDILSAGVIPMFNGNAHQTWNISSNYPCRIETVGDWFYDNGLNTFEAGEHQYIIYMDDGAAPGVVRTGKIKFYINDLLFATANIKQDGGAVEEIIPDPTITVHHPILGDIFEAGTFEMWNGSAHQTWTVTANCDWTLTKSGSWFSVDRTSGSAGTTTVKLTMADGVEAGASRSGSVTFKVNGSAYQTVHFKQVGAEKALTISHEVIGDIISASPIEMYNGYAHQTWLINSNADWTLSTTGSWYSVSTNSGSAGTTKLVLSFPDGVEPGDSRTGKLKFYFDGDLYTTITIEQDGGVDPEPAASLSVVHPWIGDVIASGYANLSNAHGQSMNWTVYANYDWKITTTGDWFTVTPKSGYANEKTTVTITTTDYAPSGYNSGSIIFKKGSTKKATISLYQGEGHEPDDYDDSFSVNHEDLGNVLDQDTIYMHNGPSHQTWNVVSNVAWSLTKSGSWFSVSPTSGSAKTSTNVVLTFPDGVEPGESREGYVKFTYKIGTKTKTAKVYIAQDGGPAVSEPEPSLTASHKLLGDVFEASPIEMHNGAGAEQNWTITSNKSWSIVTSGSWFTVSPKSGSANTESSPSTNVKITLTDYARPGSENTGTITFYVDGSKYQTVNIFQDGGTAAEPSMTLGSSDFGDVFSHDVISLKNAKTTYTWALQSNAAWSVSKSGSWFSVSPTSGSASANSTTNFSITVNSLPTSGDLTGSLTFKLDGNTYKTVQLKIPYTGTIDPTDTKLPAPKNLQVSAASATSSKVTWNAVSGAAGYNVYRSTNATSGYMKLNSSLVSSPYTDSTMKAGVNYYYTVEAVNSSGTKGSASIPYGPVSYNSACALKANETKWSPSAAGQSKTFTITKHGSHDYSVSLKQYNSDGKECTGAVTDSDHTLAKWLSYSKSGASLTLTAAKNYADAGKTAIATLTCGCGATRTITINQSYAEPAPASVSLKMDGYNGFTETSSIQNKPIASHLDYVLAPGDTLTVAAAGGNYARRLTVRIINANGKTVLDQSSTATGTSGLSKSYSYTIPDSATGIYTIYVYASNSATAGDDAQWINTSASIRVSDGSNNHTSINYPYDKKDFSDEIWNTLTKDWNLSAVHAAAIMGNIDAESGYCPYNSQSYVGADDRTKYTFATDDGVGFGLCQWTSSGRKAGLLSYAINKGSADMVWDFDTQMGYLKSELNLTKLQSYNSLYEATEWFDIWFERPHQGSSNSWPGTRYAKALNAYKKYVGSAYSEPALNFSVKQNGTNVTSGFKLSDNAAISSTATLVVSSNYYWRVSQENSTVSGWLSVTCPRLYYPNQTVICECGYAGNTTLTLKVNKAPTNGQTYSTTLVFEIYQNNHVTKKVPITLTYTNSGSDQTQIITAKRQAAVDHAKSWLAESWELPCDLQLHGSNGTVTKKTVVRGVPYSLCEWGYGGTGKVDYPYAQYKSASSNFKDTAFISARGSTTGSDSNLDTVKHGADCTELVWSSWSAADPSKTWRGSSPLWRDNWDGFTNSDYWYKTSDLSEAKPGDCLYNPKTSSGYSHFRLVINVSGTNITTIEQTADYLNTIQSYNGNDYTMIGTVQKTYSHSSLSGYFVVRYLGLDN